MSSRERKITSRLTDSTENRSSCIHDGPARSTPCQQTHENRADPEKDDVEAAGGDELAQHEQQPEDQPVPPEDCHEVCASSGTALVDGRDELPGVSRRVLGAVKQQTEHG